MDVMIDAYDASGGQAVGDSAVVVSVGMVRRKFRLVELSNDEVIINPARSLRTPSANYLLIIMARVTLDISNGSSRSQAQSWLEIDTGSGYQEIPGTKGTSYHRTSSAGQDSVSLFATAEVAKIDMTKIRIRTQRTAGSSDLQTLVNGSSILVLNEVKTSLESL
jgi:hypothetical protein